MWKTQQPLMVEDVARENRFPKLMPMLRENGVQSFCVVPLTTALRRLGAMGFGSLQRRVYQEAELTFMQEVAKQIAVAVDNVLHDESAQSAQQQLEHERDRQRLLLEINNAIVSHLGLDDLFTAVSTCLRKVIKHDSSSLVLLDPETRQYRVQVLDFTKNTSFIEKGQADPQCKGPSGVAIATRKPAVFSAQDLQNMALESKVCERLLDEGVKSLCSVPLLAHDRVRGALNVGRRDEDAFAQDDIDLLSQVAQQVAIAVENALAYQEIAELQDKLAKEKLYLEDEIRTDRKHEVQQPVELLPPLPPVVKDDADVGHHVDEDHPDHKDETDREDEDLVRPPDGGGDHAQQQRKGELNVDGDRRRLAHRVHRTHGLREHTAPTSASLPLMGLNIS